MKKLRLLLGDQLNSNHSWYHEVDENIKYLVNNIEAPFMGKIPFQKEINSIKISDYLLWPGNL